MARLEVRDFSEEDLKEIDRQKNKYGFKSREAYLRFLVKLDILSNMSEMVHKYVKGSDNENDKVNKKDI